VNDPQTYNLTPFYILIPLAYLLGAVPFALLIAKAKGRDIRKVGSGNIGATNLSRACGRTWGYVCFILDVCKGWLPMYIASNFIPDQPSEIQLILWLAVGAAAILGHIFSLYLKFKGGKGVATSLGVVLGLYPYYTIPGMIALAIWIAVVLIWQYISLASITAAIIFPAALAVVIAIRRTWLFADLWPLFIMAIIVPALVIIRHAENIKRLLEGSESKVLRRPKE
jgi:glycerol-3-phosphate acyltransferase PlsY